MVLSAIELQSLTKWTKPLIEDYLSNYENVLTVAESVSEALKASDVLNTENQIDVTTNSDMTITISISDEYLINYIIGTLNQVTVTNNLDGTITLSLPQDIATDSDVQFNSLDIINLLNSAGSLKIQEAAEGNVDLFSGTDVDDTADGKKFTVTRRAAEGDTTLYIYGKNDTSAQIQSTQDLEISSSTASGVISIGTVATNVVRLVGTYNSIGKGTGTDNLPLRHYGYITAGGLSGQKYVQWLLDDTDDYFWLTRQDTNILGLKIDMPVDLIDNNLQTSGNISNTDSTLSGDLLLTGANKGLTFGEIYASDVSDELTITGTGIANKVQITSFSVDGLSNNLTPDHTNDHLTITKAGVYKCAVSISCSSAATGGADLFGFAVFKNNGATEFANCHGHRKLSGGGTDNGSVSISGIIDLAVNDTIEVWCWNENSTDNIVIDDITLSLIQIAGT